jgi:putative transcriptional regulator
MQPKENVLIKWRLHAVMADREIEYKELAEKAGLHPVTVSKHRTLKIMPPRLDARTLQKYCRALGCQPGDLLRYAPEVVQQKLDKN